MKIRRVVIEDAEILSNLASKTFYDTFKGTCSEEDMVDFLHEYYNLNQVKLELSNADDYFYFAEVDGVPVGYIRIMGGNTGFDGLQKFNALELKRLYILNEFHGKGVAQFLMNFVFDYANEKKYEVVWLGVWEFNFRAQNFYKKIGFNDTGFKHPFPIGNTPQTDLWYWKLLNNYQ